MARKLKRIQSNVARIPSASQSLAMVQRKGGGGDKRPTQTASEAIARKDGAAPPIDGSGSLRERALLVRFSIGRWYGTGADEQVTSEVKSAAGATGDVGTFTKRFMSKDKLAQINAITSEARKFYKSITLPWADGGYRLLGADAFFEFKREMLTFEARFGAAVDDFLSRYPQYVEQERERLGRLFKDDDYPPADVLRGRYRFSLAIDALPSAEDFRVNLGAEEVERIKAEIEQRVNESVQQATSDIWERMQDAVSGIKERVEDNIIRDTLLVPLKELVALMPKLNITNDARLAELAKRAAEELLDIDPEELRGKKAAPVRADVSKKADSLLKAMRSFTGPTKH